MNEFGGQVFMCRDSTIVHNVGKKQQGVVFDRHTRKFLPNHRYPFIEDLFEVIGRDLGADNIARFNGELDGGNELFFVRGNFERHKISADKSRHGF